MGVLNRSTEAPTFNIRRPTIRRLNALTTVSTSGSSGIMHSEALAKPHVAARHAVLDVCPLQLRRGIPEGLPLRSWSGQTPKMLVAQRVEADVDALCPGGASTDRQVCTGATGTKSVNMRSQRGSRGFLQEPPPTDGRTPYGESLRPASRVSGARNSPCSRRCARRGRDATRDPSWPRATPPRPRR